MSIDLPFPQLPQLLGKIPPLFILKNGVGLSFAPRLILFVSALPLSLSSISMDLTPIPMCDTCAEEYPYMDSAAHLTCGACLYDDAVKSTDDPSVVPPLKYCKDGCGIQLGQKAGTMCRGCKRKIEEKNHQNPHSNSQYPSQSTSSSASLPILVDDVDPARISAIRSQFQIPQLSIAEHLLQSQPILVGHAQDQAYRHGEEASKRIRMDCIGQNQLCKGPRSTAIGRHHNQTTDISGAAPGLKQVVVNLKLGGQNHAVSNGTLPSKPHGIFPPGNQNTDLNTYPALPLFDPAYCSLGVGTGVLSEEHLKQEIISPTRHGQRAVRGPPALSLFFVAATYLAALNPPSSIFISDSEGEDDGSEAAHILPLPTSSLNVVNVINSHNWTGTISTSVTLDIKHIHQLADQGIDPLKIPTSSVVAAQDPYDLANTMFPQEIGTPLPDGHPAGDGRQIALYGRSAIESFGQVLPSVDSLARPMRNNTPWTNVILMALAKPNFQSTTPEAISPPLVVAKQIIEDESGDQDTYLKDLVVYHQTSCLLEEFKLAMFARYEVTIAHKNVLNSLQVVFNMVMIQDGSPYKIEELLEHSPETIPTLIDKKLNPSKWLLFDALDVFVHYTYDFFKGQALVYNIKTVNGCLTGMRIFDPRFQWSPRDESCGEIDAFKLGHQCGECCNVLKLKSTDFKYPTSEDSAEAGQEVAIDPVLETLEHIHPKQSEAEHDILPSHD
ncbi:hypothetical protein DFH28DRAFT_1154150 [Melampsora americana]|nr:hypothetical protein DFH28DRAFT_1154150 [Melampsora americana]